MLENILNAVVTALKAQGACAVREFPQSAAETENGTVICVGAEKSEVKSPGLGGYLGIQTGTGGEPDRELFGRLLRLVLRFTILTPFSKGAAECESAAGELYKLLDGLPEGLCCESLETGEVKTDEELLCYTRECRLNCTAHMVAESCEDEEFLDFRLKGTVKNVS